MKDANKFWQWVHDRMGEIGISSIRELERRADLSNGQINSRKNDYLFPTVEIAEGMCRALKVEWVEFWAKAGFVEEYSADNVQLTPDSLGGLDEEIYYSLRYVDDEFKKAVLKTIKAWKLYEELNKK